jgi:hypothetical protein
MTRPETETIRIDIPFRLDRQSSLKYVAEPLSART